METHSIRESSRRAKFGLRMRRRVQNSIGESSQYDPMSF